MYVRQSNITKNRYVILNIKNENARNPYIKYDIECHFISKLSRVN